MVNAGGDGLTALPSFVGIFGSKLANLNVFGSLGVIIFFGYEISLINMLHVSLSCFAYVYFSKSSI